jgi:hypothetical protein
MGFVAIARHRSREVTLYRQGGMNMIVNADPRALPLSAREDMPATVISAIALRVRDADLAYRHAIEMGAWAIQTRAGVMELNIPGVHGAGDSILYFVDRLGDFSIYDVDFKPIPGAPQQPPALAGHAFFRCRAGDRRRPRAGVVRFLPPADAFPAVARGALFRRGAEGHAAGQSLPQLLPAAGRAAGAPGPAMGRAAGPRRLSACRTWRRPCACWNSAASSSSTAPAPRRAGRAR